MNATRLIKLLPFAFGALLLAAPVAAAQTRAGPPDEDDFADATNIPLNSTKTVNNAELATTQGIFDDGASCDPDHNSVNSVWFKFTLADDAIMDFYSGGTRLVGSAFTSTIPLIAIYKYDISSLVEQACSANGIGLIGMSLAAGEYRVYVANDSEPLLLDGSRYRLSVRALPRNFVGERRFQ